MSLVILTVVATIIDIITMNSQMEAEQSESEFLLEDREVEKDSWLKKFSEFLECFSLIRNLEKLIHQEFANEISCLHGIRFFSMCWIIFIHTRYDLTALFGK